MSVLSTADLSRAVQLYRHELDHLIHLLRRDLERALRDDDRYDYGDYLYQRIAEFGRQAAQQPGPIVTIRLFRGELYRLVRSIEADQGFTDDRLMRLWELGR